jgi:hypothetical protein
VIGRKHDFILLARYLVGAFAIEIVEAGDREAGFAIGGKMGAGGRSNPRRS